MRFTVSSTALSCKLSALSRVINSKNSLPILGDFLFDESSSGSITLRQTVREFENIPVADKYEDNSWEADVDCDKAQKGYGYPYLTIWGIADEESIPTIEGLHGLLNFENYDERICNKDFRIVQCS